MRRGELLGLKWARTDMDIGELEIVETIVPVNHKPIWSVPKTDAGFRTSRWILGPSRFFVTTAVANLRSVSRSGPPTWTWT